MQRSTVSVGVDVDSLWHYYRIHGLDESQASDHAWSHGVPRFIELFEGLGIPATFYCVAEDIERSPACQEILLDAVHRGFEIGNHSWRHPYALTQLSAHDRALEISEGKRRLEAFIHRDVIGFRAPGYHTSAALHQPLIESGHRYESSAFPCVPYYLAKALVMGGMRLIGRKSQSILGSPKLLTSPHQPYLAGPRSPYRAALSSEAPQIAHFPVAVWWGLPLIGTLFALLGPRRSAWLGRCVARSLRRRPRHLTLEFHAADLLSLSEDELDPRLRVQPDLKRELTYKRQAFKSFLIAVAQEADVLRLDQHPLTTLKTLHVTQA